METTNASAYDTSTVTGVNGFTPTGTVTYTYFAQRHVHRAQLHRLAR